MDTSETYIKMCEKAEEIQLEWNISVGDWYLERNDPTSKDDPAHGVYFDEHLRVIGSDDDQNLGIIARMRNEEDVWLPRQDQLQEMVLHKNLNHAMSDIYAYYCDRIGKFGNKSWEQLWFAFVMKEKFNKIWNGEGWVVNDLSK